MPPPPTLYCATTRWNQASGTPRKVEQRFAINEPPKALRKETGRPKRKTSADSARTAQVYQARNRGDIVVSCCGRTWTTEAERQAQQPGRLLSDKLGKTVRAARLL